MTTFRSTRTSRFSPARFALLASLALTMIVGLPLSSQAEMDPTLSLAGRIMAIYHNFHDNSDDAFTCYYVQSDPSGPAGSFTCTAYGGDEIAGEVVGITHQKVYSVFSPPTVDGHRIRFVRELGQGAREIYEGSIGIDANGFMWLAGEFKREETRQNCGGRICPVQSVVTGPMPFRGITAQLGG